MLEELTCISVPAGIIVRGCSASLNFFEDSFNVFAHFMKGDLPADMPTPRYKCSAVFDQKWHNPHAPPSMFIRSRPRDFVFLFPQMKKVLKRKLFAYVEKVKKKQQKH